MTNKFLKLIFLGFFLIVSACSPYRVFYYPNKKLYLDPEKVGLSYSMVTYPSLNGKTLYAIIFETKQEPKGTVVHFHGNFGNVSNHFTESQFLTKYGFDVLVFDYQGYGGSEGTPGPKQTMEDGLATVRYAQEHLRNKETGVVVFGQSLGGAVATVVTAKEPLIKAAVIEAAFTTYQSIARNTLKKSVLTWILYPFYPLLLWSGYDPIKHISHISPRPVLIIHGTKDTIVPSWMSEKLFEKAKEPKKLILIEGAGHLECRKVKGKEYEQELADFFTAALKPQ